jgi:hypothetical protein
LKRGPPEESAVDQPLLVIAASKPSLFAAVSDGYEIVRRSISDNKKRVEGCDVYDKPESVARLCPATIFCTI